MSNHIIITGVPLGPGVQPGGPVPPRLEINDFIKKEDHFSLYIQAIQAIYALSPSDPLSWYQVSGIHGMPFVSWNGSPGGETGYCSHRANLFPTWHRPYIALLEQAIQKKAVEIANTYTANLKAQYLQAAQNLRQPYWDWAVNALPPDEVISKAQVQIRKPDGTLGPVNNPLLTYQFPAGKERIFPQPFSGWNSTRRTPDGNGNTNINELTETLQDAAPELTRDTLALLTLVHTWPLFSNRATSSGGFTNSLEAIHDSIHVYIGGQNDGHMGDPAVAAFDPIFYLHHTNVDRLFSLWAAINPGVGVSPMVKNGVTLTETTPLLPFWDAPNQMWPSKPVVPSSNVFNYTYPEFVGAENLNSQQLSQQILQQVNQLYGDPMQNLTAAKPTPAAAPPAQAKPAAPAAAPAPAAEGAHLKPFLPQPQAPKDPQAPVVHQSIAAVPAKPAAPPTATPIAPTAPPAAAPPAAAAPAAAPPAAAPPAAQAPIGAQAPHPTAPATSPAPQPTPSAPGTVTSSKWTARIRCNHHDIQGSFSVLLFVGDVPEDPKTWRKCSTYAGADDIFLMGQETKKHCDNCKGSDAPPDQPLVSIVEGYVHLNDAIKRQKLPSMNSDAITQYLQKNLHWRVKRINGEVVWVDSLEVVVIETSLSLPRGSLIPIAGEPHKHRSATHGRSGGSRKPPGEP